MREDTTPGVWKNPCKLKDPRPPGRWDRPEQRVAGCGVRPDVETPARTTVPGSGPGESLVRREDGGTRGGRRPKERRSREV